MYTYFILFFHSLRLLLMLFKPQGAKALMAENLILRQQLIVLSRKYQRAPRLSAGERLILAVLGAFIKPARLIKSAILIKPATIIRFHQALVKQKYHLLFSSPCRQKPGPKGPSKELIQLIVEMKQRNPHFGCPRIAMQIQNAFNLDISKDIVRRILAKYYKPSTHPSGPSWLSFIGHAKDSLWSLDLFRCESILLKTHWVMVVMDQFTRRIIGFAVQSGHVNGITLCCMFNQIITSKKLPRYLSSDHDPLFQYHRWKANLRILEIREIKSLPYIPLSHPFVERLIRNIRHEILDKLLFWNTLDLQRKLDAYQVYFNQNRSHQALKAATPNQITQNSQPNILHLNHYRWQSYCHSLFQLPIAA